MNGKTAKAARRAIYGDFSPRPEARRYKWDKSLVSQGLRRAYQQAKELYKEGKWSPTTLIKK